MRKIHLLLLLTLICTLRAFGQIPSAPGNLQSPNAASLGLYGDYPVSYFTGLPQISIPIYVVRNVNLSIPISLDYHASGVRPDVHPGWVGMNFSLSAGGLISRTVNDLPDDFNNPNLDLGANAGFYWNYGVLNTTSWNQISYMQGIARGDGMVKDTEPDEFSFSLPTGVSGKFYRSHTGTWQVRCDRPVTVTFNNQFLSVPFTPPAGSPYINYGYYKSFNGFTITDENGIQYTFGGTTDAIEYSTVFFRQNESHWNASSWYLTKVVHPHGDEITFQYARDSFVNQMYISVNNDLGTKTVNSGGWLDPSCNSWNYKDIYHSYWGELVSPVYLTTITNQKEQVKFVRSNSTELRYPQVAYEWIYSQWQQSQSGSFLPFLENSGYENTYPACLDKLQWKKLDQIRIENGGVLQKAFNFGYNNVAAQRLTLNTLTEQGKSGGLLKPYVFSYNTSQPLPPYLANKNDHWGFYNGTYADISNQNNYYTTFYNYRNPNAAFLLAGIISSIKYPTGGVTDFTFEPHYYRKQLQAQRGLEPAALTANTLCGGLRIKKISSYDPNIPAQKVDKEYFYVDGYTNAVNVSTLPSSGILGGQIKYYFDDYRANAFNASGVTYSKALFSSQSVLPANYNSQGSHIGYSNVVEKRSDGSYTIYGYSNFDNPAHRDIGPDQVLQPGRTMYEKYTSKDMNRGKLLREYLYTASDIAIRKTVFTYQEVATAGVVRSLKANRARVCPSTEVSIEEGTAYRYLTHSFLPVTETVTEYDQAGANAMTTINLYSYDPTYRLLKIENRTDSKGETYRTIYNYPFDVSVGTTPSSLSPLQYPVRWTREKHIIGTPIEKVTSTYRGGTEYVIAAEVTTSGGATGINLATAYPNKKYLFNAMGIIPKSSYVPYKAEISGAGETVTLDPNLKISEEYAYRGIAVSSLKTLLRQTGIRKLKGPWTKYSWGYDQKYLIAEIQNSDYPESAYTGFDGENTSWSILGGTTVADATAPAGRYAYNLGTGSMSKTLDAGRTYLLSYWAKSTTAGGISGASATPVRSYNGWTLYARKFSGITLLTLSGNFILDEVAVYPYEGSMSTYTFNELGSVTSMGKENNDIRYYEYDEFNRLKTVKDSQGRILEHNNYNLR